MFTLLTVLVLLVLIALLYDIVRKMSGSGIILFLGLAGIFIGERVLGFGEWRFYATGAGATLIAVSCDQSSYQKTRVNLNLLPLRSQSSKPKRASTLREGGARRRGSGRRSARSPRIHRELYAREEGIRGDHRIRRTWPSE